MAWHGMAWHGQVRKQIEDRDRKRLEEKAWMEAEKARDSRVEVGVRHTNLT